MDIIEQFNNKSNGSGTLQVNERRGFSKRDNKTRNLKKKGVLLDDSINVVLNKIEQSTLCLSEQNQLLFQQNLESLEDTHHLKQIIESMSAEITYLKEEQRKHNTRQEYLQRRRDMKMKRNRLKPRDRVTSQEFLFILSLTSGDDYESVRNFVAILMLYITGLRVGNLSALTIRHLFEMRDSGFTYLSTIKNGPSRHTIQLSTDDLRLLDAADSKIQFLCSGRAKYEPLFIGKGNRSNKGMPLDVGYMRKSINQLLWIASTKLGKYIRTHSFRVTRISDLLENTDIRGVADIIGHRSTNSTKIYDRVHVDYEDVYRAFDLHRGFNYETFEKICQKTDLY